MPKVKVRHAMVPYRRDPKDAGTSEVAFRGQIVDMPQSEVDRVNAADPASPAVVKEDEDLARPGVIDTLPVAASDAEIVSYVTNATEAEVKALLVARPELAPRIESAQAWAREQFAYQEKMLGQAADAASSVDRTEAQAELGGSAMLGTASEEAGGNGGEAQGRAGAQQQGADNPADSTSVPSTPEAGTPDTTAEAERRADAEAAAAARREADLVVLQNADAVVEHVRSHPAQAAAILEAEGRLASSQNRDVRKSVRLAVENVTSTSG